MRLSKTMVVVLVALFLCESVIAQRSRRVNRSRHNYSVPKVRGQKAKLICPVFERSRYPFHGIGFKLGDPFALTYKYYPNKHFSIAIDAGKPASGLYGDYFKSMFKSYAAEETSPAPGPDALYLAHRVKSDLIGEIKALYHVDAARIAEGLQFYVGGGWQWRATRLVYDFEYDPGDPDPQGDPFGSFEYHRRTMGPQASAGLEYSYFSIPVAAFMEVEYFYDLQADPGFRRFEGGIGLRYVF